MLSVLTLHLEKKPSLFILFTENLPGSKKGSMQWYTNSTVAFKQSIPDDTEYLTLALYTEYVAISVVTDKHTDKHMEQLIDEKLWLEDAMEALMP